MSSFTIKRINQHLAAMGITFEKVKVPARTDNLMEDMPEGTNHFHVTIGHACEAYSFYYSQGPAHKGLPENADIMYSLIMGISSSDECFEDWCSNYGYDTDSRKAFKIYQAVIEAAANMRRLFSDKKIEELQDLLQVY